MTPAQTITVAMLKAQGFALTVEARDVVRMTLGNDRRVILPDGQQKRGHHVDRVQVIATR